MTKIVPRYGSTEGGTRLFIHGTGKLFSEQLSIPSKHVEHTMKFTKHLVEPYRALRVVIATVYKQHLWPRVSLTL